MSQTAAGMQTTLVVKTTLNQPRPEKLSDFPEDVQALMPQGWRKSAYVCEDVTFYLAKDLTIYSPEHDYLAWAIENNPELARRMIVCGVEVNGLYWDYQRVYLYIALYIVKNAMLVEYLCMAGAKLEVLFAPGNKRHGLWKLHKDVQRRNLNPAEKALLQHVYFSTATETVNAQLALIMTPFLLPPLIDFVVSYIYEFDSDLNNLLGRIKFKIGNRAICTQEEQFDSLFARSLMTVAKEYFEKPQIVPTKQAAKKSTPRILPATIATDVATAPVNPIVIQYQNFNIIANASIYLNTGHINKQNTSSCCVVS